MKNSFPTLLRNSFTQRTLGLAFALSTATLVNAQTVPFETIYKFNRDQNGFVPSNLILGKNQSFYGATEYTSTAGGRGTIFTLSPTGSITTLHTFTYLEGNPSGGLAFASDGSLYGPTFTGGLYDAGTFFHLDNNLQLNELYSFTCLADGCNPAAIYAKPDGNFYVLTASDSNKDAGTIVQLDTLGQITVVHDFNITDGGIPNSILLSTDGNYYGSTEYGGSGSYSNGTIYKLDENNQFTSLYSLMQQEDGVGVAGIVQGSDGNFYGGTANGGTITNQNPYGCGLIYRYSLASGQTVLHNLDCTTGGGVLSPLIEGQDGNFYGTTYGGGSSTLCVPGCGVIFQITPSGVYTVLHQFNFNDGAYPENALIQVADGSFYGITPSGGNYETDGLVSGFGTIFHFSLPPGPAAPTNFTAKSRIPGKIKLSWTAVPGASSYNLYEGAPAAESTTPIMTGITKTNLVLSGLDSKQTYCYTVAGVNAKGVGLPSFESCVAGSRR